jgi:hypothetical protein
MLCPCRSWLKIFAEISRERCSLAGLGGRVKFKMSYMDLTSDLVNSICEHPTSENLDTSLEDRKWLTLSGGTTGHAVLELSPGNRTFVWPQDWQISERIVDRFTYIHSSPNDFLHSFQGWLDPLFYRTNNCRDRQLTRTSWLFSSGPSGPILQGPGPSPPFLDLSKLRTGLDIELARAKGDCLYFHHVVSTRGRSCERDYGD